MRNLLRQPLTEAELREVFAAHPPVPLLPPRGSEVWAACSTKPLVQKLLEELRPLLEAEIDQPLPALTDDLYAEFHRSGNRTKFEGVYFERRRRLARLVFFSLLDEESDRWIPALLRVWDEIFAERSWALAAHVVDPSGQDPLTIDLFSAETANLMAELLNLFGPEVGETRREAILARLNKETFQNYLERPAGRRWDWLEITNNWNAVCHQGVLGAALSIEGDADLLAKLFTEAQKSLPKFLEGFTADGGCSEGPGYWNYGFGWFAGLNQQLETRTGGELSLFHDDPLVAEISKFGQRSMLSPKLVANFADGGARAIPGAWIVAYLSERLNDTAGRRLARALFHRLLNRPAEPNAFRMDTFSLLRLALQAPAEDGDGTVPAFENVYFPDLAWWISHGEDKAGSRWALAVKGGHNGEHHNHNDCGSVILLLNGQPFLDEIGASEYTRDFFGPKRYGFLATRSLGHSLPLINGFEQGEGGNFEAKILKTDFGTARDEFSVDLTGCYPATIRCERVQRTLTLNREPFSLDWLDEFEIDAPEIRVDCALVTHAEWYADGDDIVIHSNGERLRISVVEGFFLRGEAHSYVPHIPSPKPSQLRRLVYVPGVTGTTARLRLRLTHDSPPNA